MICTITAAGVGDYGALPSLHRARTSNRRFRTNLGKSVRPGDYVGALHCQFLISGISSPNLSMYRLCSISLSMSCCFK